MCCNKEKVETIIQKIESGEIYIDELKQYLPMMNEIVTECGSPVFYLKYKDSGIGIPEESLDSYLRTILPG